MWYSSMGWEWCRIQNGGRDVDESLGGLLYIEKGRRSCRVQCGGIVVYYNAVE